MNIKEVTAMAKIVYELRLYIVDSTKSSIKAEKNLREFLEKKFPGRYSLKVVDVLTHPHLAEQDNIIATPTALKASPTPVRKAIGDLKDLDRVMFGLGMEVLE